MYLKEDLERFLCSKPLSDLIEIQNSNIELESLSDIFATGVHEIIEYLNTIIDLQCDPQHTVDISSTNTLMVAARSVLSHRCRAGSASNRDLGEHL